MPDIMEEFRRLDGQTLKTDAQKASFIVNAKSLDKVTFTPLSTGTPLAPSKRSNIEGAYILALAYQAKNPGKRLRATYLRGASHHNCIYVLPALRELGRVK